VDIAVNGQVVASGHVDDHNVPAIFEVPVTDAWTSGINTISITAHSQAFLPMTIATLALP
jgi:hypothetical protein